MNNIYHESYKNYNIWQVTKTITHKNKISGHSWIEEIPKNRFYIGEKLSAGTFKTVAKAQEHIDYLIKVKGN